MIRWLDRCISAKSLSDEQQALFPIIQGGLDLKLREHCAREMIKRARVGIAIGGWHITVDYQLPPICCCRMLQI